MRVNLTLCWVKPKITRTLILPEWYSLHDLHLCICDVMGWRGRNREEFCILEDSYTRLPVHSDNRAEYREMIRTTLLCEMPMQFMYRYDIEDDWEHVVEMVKMTNLSKAACDMLPKCIGGTFASPPEDIGGPDEYRKFCRAMTKPTHRDHAKVVAGNDGQIFDPGRFDAEEIEFKLSSAGISGVQR